jgi:hypothetical protein
MAAVKLRRVAPSEVKSLALDPVDDTTRAQAGAIVDDVKKGGEAKLLEIATKFGDVKPGAWGRETHCSLATLHGRG